MDRAVALPVGGSNTSIERRVSSSVLEKGERTCPYVLGLASSWWR